MAVDPATTSTLSRGASARSPRAKRPSRGGGGAADPARIERQRARKLVAAAEAVREFPFAGLSTAGANGGPGVSREAFEDHLAGREACLLAAFQEVLALAGGRASVAFQVQEGWLERVRAGLLALLEFFDEEPALAQFLVVHSAQAGPAVLARRGEVLDRLAVVLDYERAPARGYPPPLTAEAVLSGVLGVLHGRLSGPDSGSLVDVAGPLMSFIVLPFLGARAARRELSRPLDAALVPAGPSAAVDLLQHPGGRGSHRTVAVLRVIGSEPGLSNREVGLRAGVTAQSQISKLLARLAQLGLIENTRDPRIPGPANAWALTANGQKLGEAIGHEAPAPEPGVAFDLPPEFAGRLDHGAVLVLRAIGEQPWLSNREVALRAGVGDRERSYALKSLVGLGLVVNMRDPQRRGSPNEWRLTASGEQLDGHLGRETPAAKRSLALDLMRESGGRLKPRAVSVLRVIGAEPGLSNLEVGARVGVKAQIHVSQILARLAERGLIENVRTGGRENVWQLTASGAQLETAIRQEAPAPLERRMALDLLKDRGGRLNHRIVSVLRVIGAEPGISNNEIALRVGIRGRGDTSTLLARLAGFGLISNTGTAGRKNVWRLTATGKDLEAAVRHDTADPGR
jgi:DNA-binding MarR family transcriptional regulator